MRLGECDVGCDGVSMGECDVGCDGVSMGECDVGCDGVRLGECDVGCDGVRLGEYFPMLSKTLRSTRPRTRRHIVQDLNSQQHRHEEAVS